MNWASREKTGRLISHYRDVQNLSQEYVARRADISVKTLSAWEKGLTSPDADQLEEILDIVGKTQVEYAIDFEYWDEKSRQDSSTLRSQIISLVDAMSNLELQELLFLLSSYHGGDRYAMMQLWVAHFQCDMDDRYRIAQLIESSYALSYAKGRVQFPDSPQPDMAALHEAVSEGRQAALRGDRGYKLKRKD